MPGVLVEPPSVRWSAREWDRLRPADPDPARRPLEQAWSIIERAIHLRPKAEAVICACRRVSLALDLSYRPQTERIRTQRHRLHGLGPSAGDLLTLRDRLAEELGHRWWPTRDWEGEPNGHRQR